MTVTPQWGLWSHKLAGISPSPVGPSSPSSPDRSSAFCQHLWAANKAGKQSQSCWVRLHTPLRLQPSRRPAGRLAHLEHFDLAAGRMKVFRVFLALVLLECVDLDSEWDSLLSAVFTHGKLRTNAVHLHVATNKTFLKSHLRRRHWHRPRWNSKETAFADPVPLQQDRSQYLDENGRPLGRVPKELYSVQLCRVASWIGHTNRHRDICKEPGRLAHFSLHPYTPMPAISLTQTFAHPGLAHLGQECDPPGGSSAILLTADVPCTEGVDRERPHGWCSEVTDITQQPEAQFTQRMHCWTATPLTEVPRFKLE